MNDLISRSYIINIIEMWMKVPSYSESERNIMRAIDYEVRTAPSAETKKGRWIVEHGVFMHDGIYGDMYHCSVCGYRERNPEGFNYCPNCGAKMEASE